MKNLHNLSSVRTDEINAVIYYYEAGDDRLWHVIYQGGKLFIRYNEANVSVDSDRDLIPISASHRKAALKHWEINGSPIIPHDNK